MKNINKLFISTMLGLLVAIVLVAAQGDFWTSGYDSGNARSPWRVNSDGNLIPGADDTYDIGTSSSEVQDIYIDGTATIDTLQVDGNAAVTGNSTFTGVIDVSGTTLVGVYYGLPTSGYTAGDVVIDRSRSYRMYVATATVTGVSCWVLVGGQSPQ